MAAQEERPSGSPHLWLAALLVLVAALWIVNQHVRFGPLNLLFILMSLHPGEMWSFMTAISGDNFSQGFAGTVLVAFMSALANRNYTATQYALLGSLANLPGKLIGGVSGFMVEASSYTAFFVFSALSIVPTLLLLAWLWPRLAPDGPARAP